MLEKFAVAALLSLGALANQKYACAELRSKSEFQYGRFKTRMQASEKGTVSTFFLYWTGPNWNPEGWNEIDIAEVAPSAANPFSTNTFRPGPEPNKQQNQQYIRGFAPGNGYHIYELEWTPEHIIWRLDGYIVRQLERGSSPDVEAIDKPMKIMINFWQPTFNWGEGFDESKLPIFTKYDYLEAYSYNKDTKEFEFAFRDDFNSFNHDMWYTEEGNTFNSNNCNFYGSQAYTEDGKMVLKMEKNFHAQKNESGQHVHGYLHS